MWGISLLWCVSADCNLFLGLFAVFDSVENRGGEAVFPGTLCHGLQVTGQDCLVTTADFAAALAAIHNYDE
jgi:hypothetical protein